MKKGIDVSFAQGKLIWENINTDFAIIRAGFGKVASQKDSQFENNYEGCKKNKIPVGTYWYSYALSPGEAVEEARACLSVIKGKVFEYPVFFDIEERSQLDLGKKKCTEITEAFLNTLEKSGYWVGIYSSKSHLENYIEKSLRTRYAIWVAHYGVEKTNYDGTFGIWQYTSEGNVKGVNGNVDMNYSYQDYPLMMKEAGLNGFKNSESVLDMSGYKKGDSTTGSLALKELLMIAKILGINKYGMDENKTFGDGTSNAVNYLLEKWGYKKNGIAGEKFVKKLRAEIEKKIK